MRFLVNILALLAITVVTTGCFKDEKQGTTMHIALYSQNVAGDPVVKTTSEVEAYAFWIEKNSDWSVASWEDALDRRITNTKTPSQQLSTPDVVGVYTPEAEYQLSIELWTRCAFIVVVDKTNEVYAYRKYETPMNLANTYVQLHLYASRNSGNANGWNSINPFPDKVRESLVGTDEEQTVVTE
jgi:hypothetical protein